MGPPSSGGSGMIPPNLSDVRAELRRRGLEAEFERRLKQGVVDAIYGCHFPGGKGPAWPGRDRSGPQGLSRDQQ
jgi:hypothetical protein